MTASVETVADIASEVGFECAGARGWLSTVFRHAPDVLSSPGPDVAGARRLGLRRPRPHDGHNHRAAVGFGHYGWFAAEYRRRYGRKPSETLRAR